MPRSCVPLLAVVSFTSSVFAQSYTMSSDPWVAWAPVWVAQEKGMWRQHGVDVHVVGFTANDGVQALAAHKVDFSMAMAGTAVGMRIDRGQDVVVLAEVDWSHGGDKLLMPKGGKLADLHGKRIGLYEASPAVLMFLAAELATVGLEPKDVDIVEIDDPDALASQIVAGHLAAAILYEPFVQPALKNGTTIVVGSTADFPGVMPECLLAMRDRIDTMPPGHVVAVLQGWIDATAWVKDPANEAELLRLCVAHAFGDRKVTIVDARQMLQNVRIHDREALRERNLGDGGIRQFLGQCVAFELARVGRTVDAKFGPLFDPKWMQQALGDAVASPTK